ncbi:MAG: hypothetical protein ACOVQI_13040, partial [Tagaea sp.]
MADPFADGALWIPRPTKERKSHAAYSGGFSFARRPDDVTKRTWDRRERRFFGSMLIGTARFRTEPLASAQAFPERA